MKIKVTRDIHVWIDGDEVSREGKGGANVFYAAGFEGTAPRAHIDYIVEKGAGERLGGDDKADAARAK